MPRDPPIGNGSFLVNFDEVYRLRDVYFPMVGGDNNTVGHPCPRRTLDRRRVPMVA